MYSKTTFYTCFFSLCFMGTLQAGEWLPEAKAGYFLPSNHYFKKIYGGGGIYSLELNWQAWKGFYPWINASYFTKSGHTIGERSKTDIRLVPCQIGLKYVFDFRSNFRIYAGLGAAPTYVNIHDHSRYFIQSVHKWGIGGVAKIGAYANMGKFFLDFFTDYSFTKVHFHDTHHGHLVRHNADVSGWTFGVGIGYRFGSPKKPAAPVTPATTFMLPEEQLLKSENSPAEKLEWERLE